MYPLRFKPILKRHIWGGRRLLDIKRVRGAARADSGALYGESWDVSTLDGSVSVAANGFLKGNDLRELIEVYMGDLVGERIFSRCGLDFPLLLKHLDCADRVSVQVHPDDSLAAERHGSSGKSEMWYVVSAEPGAKVYIGFKERGITREEYIAAVAEGRVADIICPVEVHAGDAFYIPAGTVHSMSGRISVVEIQQAADITYRIFDWNRSDSAGNARELHTALAVDAIDFGSDAGSCRRSYTPQLNEAVQLVKCEYFTTNILKVEGRVERDFCRLDSFVLYVCVEGKAVITADGSSETLVAGDVVMIPAEVNELTVEGSAALLECYIE